MTNLFRAEQRSVAFSIATLRTSRITVPLTVILVVVYKEGPLGIIVGNLSGTLVVFIALLGYRREQLGLQFDRKLLHSLNRFGFPLMGAALAMWVMNFGDRFMISKLLHGQYAITQVGQYSLANKISSAMVLLFTAFQIAWPAFAYSIEDEERGEARLLLRPHVPDVHRRLGGGRPEPVRAVDRALPRAQAELLAGRGRDPGARVLRASSSPASSSSRSPPAARAGRSSTGSPPTAARDPQLHAQPLADPGLRDARRRLRDPRRASSSSWSCGRGTRSASTRSRTSGGGSSIILLAAGAADRNRRGASALARCSRSPSRPCIRSLLAAFGFYLPAERKRLRRLLPAHN